MQPDIPSTEDPEDSGTPTEESPAVNSMTETAWGDTGESHTPSAEPDTAVLTLQLTSQPTNTGESHTPPAEPDTALLTVQLTSQPTTEQTFNPSGSDLCAQNLRRDFNEEYLARFLGDHQFFL